MEVGVDLVEIERIKTLALRTPRFLTRVFTPSEIAYCRGKKNPWPHFAVRFAAKEAVFKTLGRGGVPLKNISVAHDRQGRPFVLIDGKPAKRLKLSLSHGRDHAVAVALHL